MAADGETAEQKLKREQSEGRRREAARDAAAQAQQAYGAGSFLTTGETGESNSDTAQAEVSAAYVARMELGLPVLVAIPPAIALGGLYGMIPGNGGLGLLERAVPSLIVVGLVVLVGICRFASLPRT